MAAQTSILIMLDVAMMGLATNLLHVNVQCSQNRSNVRKSFYFSTHYAENAGKLSADNQDDNLEVNEWDLSRSSCITMVGDMIQRDEQTPATHLRAYC